MKRLIGPMAASLTLVLGWSLVDVNEANAQGYSRRTGPSRASQRYRSTRPRVSPYLNLLGGAAGGAEYQTLVRPLNEAREFQARQSMAFDQLQRDVDQGFSDLESAYGVNGQLRATGHASTYFNYSHYYTGLGGSAGGGRPAGGRGAGSIRRAPASRSGGLGGGGFGGGIGGF